MQKLILVAGLIAFAGAAGAQAPTREEQMACRADAQQHCASAIGKPEQMKTCLAANKDKLSAQCKAVIESRK